MPPDDRLKVRHPDGRVGYVEKIITSNMCTVQFVRGGYYVVCDINELEPVGDNNDK